MLECRRVNVDGIRMRAEKTRIPASENQWTTNDFVVTNVSATIDTRPYLLGLVLFLHASAMPGPFDETPCGETTAA